MIAIDFETYYDDDHTIREQGMVGYIEDPRFHPYMVSLVGQDNRGDEIAYSGDPDDAPWHRVDNIDWVSHNMAFDGYIWKWMTGKGKRWGEGPSNWFCTADLAVYCHAPRSLVGAVRALLPCYAGHGKDMRNWAKGKTPDEIKALGKWEEMCEYALLDSAECLELWKKYGYSWPTHERKLSQLTAQWGWRGVQIDTEKLNSSLRLLEDKLLDAECKIPWAGDKPITSHLALIAQCNIDGIPAPASTSLADEDFQKWLKKYGEEFPYIQAMIDYRRINKMFALLKAIKNLVREDGSMPYSIKYFGAHTGRWSGGAERDTGDVPKTINMQNIYAQTLFGIDVRSMFVPREGHSLIICDLSQIEPRCLAYLTKQKAFLKLVGEGSSPYEAHARLTMHYKDDEPLKVKDPAKYKLAKARVLSLGYGAGAVKFKGMAEKAGLPLSEGESKKTVKDFRASNPEIVGFWKRLDALFKTSMPRHDVKPEPLVVTLPSGRELVYLNPEIRRVKGMPPTPVATTTIGGNKVPFYGGKICENVVQATARDVFGHMLLEVEEYLVSSGNGNLLFHVHDEVILEVPTNKAERVREDIERIMSTEVPWLPGCPLAAEADITSHYKK